MNKENKHENYIENLELLHKTFPALGNSIKIDHVSCNRKTGVKFIDIYYSSDLDKSFQIKEYIKSSYIAGSGIRTTRKYYLVKNKTEDLAEFSNLKSKMNFNKKSKINQLIMDEFPNLILMSKEYSIQYGRLLKLYYQIAKDLNINSEPNFKIEKMFNYIIVTIKIKGNELNKNEDLLIKMESNRKSENTNYTLKYCSFNTTYKTNLYYDNFSKTFKDSSNKNKENGSEVSNMNEILNKYLEDTQKISESFDLNTRESKLNSVERLNKLSKKFTNLKSELTLLENLDVNQIKIHKDFIEKEYYLLKNTLSDMSRIYHANNYDEKIHTILSRNLNMCRQIFKKYSQRYKKVMKIYEEKISEEVNDSLLKSLEQY